MAIMTTPDGGEGGPMATQAGPTNMVPPMYYRTPFFPYAGLNAQLQDALGLSGRGAGVYANMMTGKLQSILNSAPNLGGGLLGKSAYARTTGPVGGPGMPPGYPPGGYQPPGMPPGGFTPPAPSGPVPPELGYPLHGRPNPGPAPTGPARPPNVPPPMPPGQPTSRGGLLNPTPKSAPTPGGLFDPGTGNTSQAAMVQYFNSLPDDTQKANFIRAIDQYSLGKGGAANLGAALQQGLRNSMGKSAFDAWSGTNIGAKAGVIGREGLPSWLISALGG